MKPYLTLKSLLLALMFTFFGVNSLFAQSDDKMNVVLTEDPLSLIYLGDVNQDHGVNINDVVAIINQMAGTATWEYADVNGDKKADINDVVAVINQMANGSNANAYSFNAARHRLEYVNTDDIEKLSVRVKITRGITSGRQELPIQFAGGSVFSAPSSVTFEDGSDVAYCKVTATRDLKPGETAQFTVSIDTASVAPGGMTPTLEKIISQCVLTTTVTVFKDYTWTSLGMGTFADKYVFTNNPYPVEIQKAEENPDLFRVIKPYHEGLAAEGKTTFESPCPYIQFQLLHPGDQIGTVTVTKDSLVYYENFATGMVEEIVNGEAWGLHPSKLGSYAVKEEAWLHNFVEEYQSDGLPGLVRLAPIYRLMGTYYMYNYSQQADAIVIAFPGYRIPIYNADISFTSVTKESDGKDYVNGTVTLGEDVDHAWVMAVPYSMGIGDAINAIADGTITAAETADDATYKYYTVHESGDVKIPMPQNAGTGKYLFMVLTFSSKGKVVADAKDYASVDFEYENTTETWTPKYIGTYNYDMYFSGMQGDLVLSQSSIDPTHYRIENWREGVDFYFTMDSDSLLAFDNFSTGYVDEDYGEVSIAHTGYGSMNRSHFDGLAFHFKVSYYVSARNFGYGWETFVITGFPEDAGKNFNIGLSINYTMGDDFMDVDVTFGADVDHAWVFVVPDSIGVTGTYKWITDFKFTYYIPVSHSEKVHINMPPSTTETGTYHVVAFAFDSSGREIEDFRSWNYATMYYKNPNDPVESWIPRYTGTYSFSLFLEGDMDGYTIYQSDMYPTHYKIENWLTPEIDSDFYQNTTFYFTLNDDNTIYFDTFNIGYVHPTYGEVQAADLHNLRPDSYPAGYFDGSVFHFQITYIVEAGAFGRGEETFTISSTLAKQRKPKPLKPSLHKDLLKGNLELCLEPIQ